MKQPKFKVGQAVDVLPVRVHVEQVQNIRSGGYAYYCDDGVVYVASQLSAVRQGPRPRRKK
jgi:hypothetical protein